MRTDQSLDSDRDVRIRVARLIRLWLLLASVRVGLLILFVFVHVEGLLQRLVQVALDRRRGWCWCVGGVYVPVFASAAWGEGMAHPFQAVDPGPLTRRSRSSWRHSRRIRQTPVRHCSFTAASRRTDGGPWLRGWAHCWARAIHSEYAL